MSETTALDAAHAAMQAGAEAESARLRFYECVGDSALFLMLAEEADGDSLHPEVFELSAGRFVLGFDRPERLAQFAGRPVPYAALSGRVLAGMLAEQGIGLGLNLDVAPSSILIPPEAMVWLTETLGNTPEQVHTGLHRIAAPAEMPDRLLAALGDKLLRAAGLAQSAYLVTATHRDGSRRPLLGFIDAPDRAQAALAQAVTEALTFSGLDSGALDVGFFAASDGISDALARHGVRLELPQPHSSAPTAAPTAPGRDPDRPPILR